MRGLPHPTPWHDVAGGLLLAGACLLAGPRARRRLAVGTAVGLAWELPFTALKQPPRPLFTDVQPWPLPAPTQPLVHALWDGGLLVVGGALTGRRRLSPFRWRDLAVLTAWGAGQELVAELVGNGRVWQWQERWYNPALFRRGDVAYTLLPQLVWTVAPAVFHAVLVRLEADPRLVDLAPEVPGVGEEATDRAGLVVAGDRATAVRVLEGLGLSRR